MKLQCVLSSSLALATTVGAARALALQGQPVSPERRDVGLIVREMIQGQSSAPGGVPLVTITGTPFAQYVLIGNFGTLPGLVDVATDLSALGITGPLSAPINVLPNGLFTALNGTFGVLPASGRQDLNLSLAIPPGSNGSYLDMQVLMVQPDGSLELSNGQLRQMQFVPMGAGWTLNASGFPGSAAGDWRDIEQGDIDGDGDNDSIGCNFNGQVTVWRTTNGQRVLATTLGDVRATSAELGDLDNDGWLDLAVAYFQQPEYVRVWRNQGVDASGTWLGFAELPSVDIVKQGTAFNTHPADLEIADFDGNGARDIVLACGFNPAIGERNRVLFNTLDPANGMALGFVEMTNTNLPAILDDTEDCEAFDFDLDGDIDIIVANVEGPPPGASNPFGTGIDYILVNQGGIQGGVEGVFVAPLPNPLPPLNDESLDIAVGDLTGDQRPDLFVTNWALINPFVTNVPVRDRLLLNTGSGLATSFTDRSDLLPDAPGSGVPATFGVDAEIFDFDFDGDLDVVTALGTLGNPNVAALPNSSLGVVVFRNLGLPNAAMSQDALGSLGLSAVSSVDFFDIEAGDWAAAPTSGTPPFGRYFDKDFGAAARNFAAPVTTGCFSLDRQ